MKYIILPVVRRALSSGVLEPAYTLVKSTLSEGLAHSTVHNHLRQLSVHPQSGALIFISELPGVI